MAIGPDRRFRKHIRLRHFDYSSDGYYFVTLATTERRLLFRDDRLRRIVEQSWLWLAERYVYVDLDEYVVMPNHFHGVLVINRGDVGGSRAAATAKVKPLGQLVGAFKTVSTKVVNELHGTPGARLWQENFFERVIRSERELDAIRQYVIDNPAKWDFDPHNSERTTAGTIARPTIR